MPVQACLQLQHGRLLQLVGQTQPGLQFVLGTLRPGSKQFCLKVSEILQLMNPVQNRHIDITSM